MFKGIDARLPYIGILREVPFAVEEGVRLCLRACGSGGGLTRPWTKCGGLPSSVPILVNTPNIWKRRPPITSLPPSKYEACSQGQRRLRASR